MGLRRSGRRNPHKRKPERVRMPPSPGGMRKRKLTSNHLFRIAKNQRAGIKKTAQSWRTFVAAHEPYIAFSFPLLRTRCLHLVTVRGVAMLRKRRVNYRHGSLPHILQKHRAWCPFPLQIRAFAPLPMDYSTPVYDRACREKVGEKRAVFTFSAKYSLQGTTQGRYLTGGVPPVRFSM